MSFLCVLDVEIIHPPFASKPPGTFELMRKDTYRNKKCIIDADIYHLLHASMCHDGRARAVM